MRGQRCSVGVKHVNHRKWLLLCSLEDAKQFRAKKIKLTTETESQRSYRISSKNEQLHFRSWTFSKYHFHGSHSTLLSTLSCSWNTPHLSPLLFASLYLLSSYSCARLHLCCLIHPPRPSLPLHFIASLDSTSSRCWGWERWKNMVRKKEGERGRGNRAKGIRKTEWEQIEIKRSSGEAYDESLEEYGEERKWKKRMGMG